MVSHINLLANLEMMKGCLTYRDESEPVDGAVCWLPLYHDMGLVGCLYQGLYYPATVTYLGPEQFLAKPASWLQALSRYRAVISPAPNFAYGLCASKIRDQDMEGVDLSQKMLAEARRKGIYDRLERAEAIEFLRADPGEIGLITAADVAINIGPLPPLLAAALAALAPGGLFGFSLELHDGAGTLLQRRQLRYAHNAEEALAESRGAGFEIVTSQRMGIRRERGVPVDGLVVLLRKP